MLSAALGQYSKEIVSILVPILVWVLNGGLRRKARLLWTEQHSSSILTEEKYQDGDETKSRPVAVCNRSLYFKNAGSQAAKSIELVFNWQPQCMSLVPHRCYQEKSNPDGRYIIQIDNLAPKEWFVCNLFSVRELPQLVTVRCEQTVPRYLESSPQEVHPRWKMTIVAYLMAVGLATSVYLLLVVSQYILIKT